MIKNFSELDLLHEELANIYGRWPGQKPPAGPHWIRIGQLWNMIDALTEREINGKAG